MKTSFTRRRWLATTALTTAALGLARGHSHAQNVPGGKPFIKLDQNENPFGLSQQVEAAILQSIGQSNRYPMRELAALRDLIAEREEVARDRVILGGGATEIFSLAALCYARPGTEVVVAEPTYAGFVGYTQSLGANLISVPVTENWEADLNAMLKRVNQNTSLVYICNPNNPTGTISDGTRLRDFCRELTLKCPVIVDEAYLELVEDSKRTSMLELTRRGAPVIVVRTFSKIYGLAGLRVGYGIARADIIADLRRRQTTFCSVNRLGVAAARAAYLDTDYVARSRQRIATARAQLYPVLEQWGHKPISGSQANFIAFEAKGGSPQLVTRLRNDFNIGVRSYTFLGKNWVRVSMGTPEEMTALTSALKEIG